METLSFAVVLEYGGCRPVYELYFAIVLLRDPLVVLDTCCSHDCRGQKNNSYIFDNQLMCLCSGQSRNSLIEFVDSGLITVHLRST